jgi:agmatinase
LSKFFKGLSRSSLQGPTDLDDDVTAGFQLIHAFDIDDFGVPEVVRRIKQRIGNSPVMISLDVDVMDPSTAPASMSSLVWVK